MAAISTSNHPKLLWPGIAGIWGTNYERHATEYTDLFEIKGSSKNREEDVQVNGFGLAPIKAEGTAVKYDTTTQGYTSTYTHVAYALGFIVTYEEMKDNLYMDRGGSRAESNAFSMRQTKEIVAANVINRATSSSYVGGDGVELMSSLHPSDAGTWANELATPADLSEQSLEDLLTMVMIAEDNQGHPAALKAMTLHIHPSEWWNANRVLKSSLQSDSANNDVNVLKLVNALPGGIKMNHYFTDTDQWGVRTNAPRGLLLFDRDSYPLQKDNDFDTDNAKAKSYMRFSCGWTNPLGWFGSAGG